MSEMALLLVEHEEPTRAYLAEQLADDGFEVISADRARQALELAAAARPDVVVLGTALPDGSGYEVCRRLRQGGPGRGWDTDVPIILVSRRGCPEDRIRGFERGADDFVVHPVLYEELLARIRAVLRRSAGPRRDRLSVEGLEVDVAARLVRVDGRPVQLSAKEHDLLVALARDPERVFRKDELLRDVWGFRAMGRTRTLDSHASRLRKKLNGPGDQRFVVNVWGVGYRLVAPRL
jgi:DNA-binding response OmpR family regulator